MFTYPDGVGMHLTPKLFPTSSIDNLIKRLPNNLVIRVYGLSGVGKRSVCTTLSHVLNLPYVHAGLLFRAITFVFEKYKLERTKQNIEQVVDEISLYIDQENQPHVMYAGDLVTQTDLENHFIESHLATYTQDNQVQESVSQLLSDLLINGISSSCVLDSIGGMPSYLEEVIGHDKDVIQFLLMCDEDESFRRYYDEQVANRVQLNPFYEPDTDLRKELFAQFKVDVVDRNTKDIEWLKASGSGLITPDSLIIDTTHIDIDEAVGTILYYLNSQYGVKNKKM